jgi:hypothetical protein
MLRITDMLQTLVLLQCLWAIMSSVGGVNVASSRCVRYRTFAAIQIFKRLRRNVQNVAPTLGSMCRFYIFDSFLSIHPKNELHVVHTTYCYTLTRTVLSCQLQPEADLDPPMTSILSIASSSHSSPSVHYTTTPPQTPTTPPR